MPILLARRGGQDEKQPCRIAHHFNGTAEPSTMRIANHPTLFPRLPRLALLAALAFIPTISQAAQTTSAAVEQRVDKLLNAMTLDEKIDYIGGDRDFYIRPIPRLGIPEIKMADGPTGIRNYGDSTQYPAGIALAASWNPDLAAAYGRAVGHDARARGVHIWLAPGVNIYRAPMCGRNFEYFGEDPLLASRIAVALIRSVQSEGVLATIKHYAANNMEYGRNDVSSNIEPRTLREIYLATFQAAVQEAGVACVMDAYNLVNGVHCTANHFLNTEFLKQECGFDGVIMSDWGAVHETLGVANGGMDLEMPSGKYLNRKTLTPLIQSGKVTEATINDKVRRILRVIVRAGFLDRPQLVESYPRNSLESASVALDAAREGIVLLKNDKRTLPLDAAKMKTVAVFGPMGGPGVPAGGGSSLVRPAHQTAIVDAVRARLGASAKVEFLPVLENAGGTGALGLAATSRFEHVTTDGTTLPGLRGEYFPNSNLAGAPTITRVENSINFDWQTTAPIPGHGVKDFSARWTGRIRPEESGTFTLAARCDDGMRVWLNGELVVDEWTAHAALTRRVERELRAGRAYDLKVEYFQLAGEAVAQVGWGPSDPAQLQRAVDAAKAADAAIVCVGFGEQLEGEGDDRTFSLPPGQDTLIKAIAAANPRTVVVIASGGGVDMRGWLPRVSALLQAWYPGQEGGRAIADILFGDVCPSGKLPATFEKRWEDNPVHDSYHDKGSKKLDYTEGIFVGYRGYDKRGVAPQFPFGHGLSYTTFRYGAPKAEVAGTAAAPQREGVIHG